MKRFLIIPTLFLALLVAGCGAGGNIGDFLKAATTTVTNPVDAVDIYRVKNVYAATLQAVDDYRTYCWGKAYAAILADPIMKPVCVSRRKVVLAAQAAQPKAASAVLSAEVFVRDNPTLNATTAITAAWQAVTDFKNAVPVVK